MKVLVTGATGFVGGHVVRALLARGHEVRCLVRSPAGAEATELREQGCEVVQGDVTDPASLRRAVEGTEAVIHLVSIMRGQPRDYERIMSRGTRDLVAAAEEAGLRRFVLMSALGVDEQTKDLVPYYRAKWEMERAVEESPLEHVIFRPSFVFGRGGGALPTFVRIVRLAPVTPVVGGGQRIQPIDAGDVAEFFARAVDEPAAANRLFELGGPDAVDWNELYDRIKRVRGSRRPSVKVPMALMRLQAPLLERLPTPPVTSDQLKMLSAGDNTTDVRPALEVFGIPLKTLDEQLRAYA